MGISGARIINVFLVLIIAYLIYDKYKEQLPIGGLSQKQTQPSRITLTYFPLRGRGETIRLALEAFQIDYLDNQISGEEWSIEKTQKNKFPFGKLPQLTDNEKNIVESNAILLYIQRKVAKLSNEDDQSKLEQFIFALEDIRKAYGEFAYNSKLNDEDKRNYIENKIPSFFAPFEQILISNGGFYGKGHYLIGDELTVADISLFQLIEAHLHPDISPLFLSEFPMLNAFYQRIKQQPNLSKYLNSDRRPKQINGSRSWVK